MALPFSSHPPASKRHQPCQSEDGHSNIITSFHSLHDDIVVSIFASFSSTAASPSDLINVMLTCKRFHALVMHPFVLANVATPALQVRAACWSNGAQRFLERCAHVGNLDACFTLGMIQFYCLGNTAEGASQMMKAALGSHAEALYALAVTKFNGSGGTKENKNLRDAVILCRKAASFGHITAMRELGYCLQDGCGIPQNYHKGLELLIEANVRELAIAMSCCNNPFTRYLVRIFGSPQAFLDLFFQYRSKACHPRYERVANGANLLANFIPLGNTHIANRFLVDWFNLYPPSNGLRMCSYLNCGRPETRSLEFRRCSACGKAYYCSRACQARDWRIRHKHFCGAMLAQDEEEEEEEEEEGGNAGGEEDTIARTSC